MRDFRETSVQRREAISFRLVETEWGHFGLVLNEREQVVATFLPQSESKLRKLIARAFPAATEVRRGAEAFCREVKQYFAKRRPIASADIVLSDLPDFQRRVLEACRRIPFGSTASYADLARAAGSPGAARAVGSAMARNPLPLVIPCHRVLCSDGSIGGFSSPEGIAQKERLLQLEDSLERVRKRQTVKPRKSIKSN